MLIIRRTGVSGLHASVCCTYRYTMRCVPYQTVWFGKAAAAGNVEAMASLAGCYDHGTNAAQAATWYLAAADKGEGVIENEHSTNVVFRRTESAHLYEHSHRCMSFHTDVSHPLAFKNDQPPLAKSDRRSQFDRYSFAEHPHLTQERTVYDGRFGRNGGSSLADPVWRIHPLTELIILAL